MADLENNKPREIVPNEDFFVIPEDGSQPYLLAFRCNKCGTLYLPRLTTCSECWSEELSPVPLSRVGKLYTYTIVYVPQRGMEAPFAIGYVDFPEGVRVGAQIELPPEKFSKIKIGMELAVAAGLIRYDSEGNRLIGYKFQSVE